MNKGTSVAGIILVALGLILLLGQYGIRLWPFVAPAALIIVGVWLIQRRLRRAEKESVPGGLGSGYSGPSASGGATIRVETSLSSGSGQSAGTSSWRSAPPPPPPPRMPEMPQYNGAKIKYSKFIGDMYIDCKNLNLQNVEISMFVGDIQVNLSGGQLAPGLNRMIISGFLGDVQVMVPRDLPVFCHCSSFGGDADLFGRRSNGFGNTLDSQTDDYSAAQAKLYIAVNNFIGDIRVYRV